MKKNLFLITTLILLITLTLGACGEPVDEHTHSFAIGWTYDTTHHWHKATCGHTSQVSDKAPHSLNSNNKCTVCGYEKKITSTPSKKAEEVITEFLLPIALGSNFSVSVRPSPLVREQFELEDEYVALLDGTNIYASTGSEQYYIEESADGRYFIYTQVENEWHRSIASEGFEYPTDIQELLLNFLGEVDWEDYDERKGVANGYITIDNNEIFISFTMRDDGATVELYTVQRLGNWRIPVLLIGRIELYDIGNTTVTLPEEFIDDTETSTPESN